jgi:hypothetical protein
MMLRRLVENLKQQHWTARDLDEDQAAISAQLAYYTAVLESTRYTDELLERMSPIHARSSSTLIGRLKSSTPPGARDVGCSFAVSGVMSLGGVGSNLEDALTALGAGPKAAAGKTRP